MKVNIKVKIKQVAELVEDYINIPDSARTEEVQGIVSDYVTRQFTRVETFYHNIEIVRRS